MRKKIIWLLISAVAALAVVGCRSGNSSGGNDSVKASASISETPLASAPALTMEQKLQDFEYMWTIMEENYPFFEVNKRLNGVDWLANKEKYRSEIAATRTDEEFFKGINSVLSELNNLHTEFINEQGYNMLTEIYTQVGAIMEPWLQVLQQPEVLARYNKKSLLKQQSTTEASPVEGADGTENVEAGANEQTSGNVKKTIIKPYQIAYLGLSSFAGQFMEQDAPEIREFLTEVKDYKTLLIDIRGNGGGSTNYWRLYIVPLLINKPVNYSTYYLYRGGEYAEAFLQPRHLVGLDPIVEISKKNLPNIPPEATTMFKDFMTVSDDVQPIKSVGFKGKIYLLVDHAVFSASEGFAAFAKGSGFATVVGAQTGGDGLGADPLLAALPNSGYVFRFSLEMGLTSDGSCNEEVKTIPDVEVEPDTTKPLLEQPAIQKVLELAGS
ncbi:S41 family peptidase [Paenibacillus monticola]|uniref:Peptidase S41 n=1 Tax=Paenibacillus monticola TaxID=2666075 RepID=A0A7X2H654_9BACL|nr:S41 family peptidase [Paenibacillus monticola]MRN54229.1 peptidase S41 [Paenibacillus monticola]